MGEDVDEHRERLRAEWGAKPEGVVAFDTELQVVWANDALGEMLGYDLTEWQGRQPFEAVHPDDLPRAYAAFEGLSAHSGPRSPNTFRVLRADGATTVVQLWGENRLEDPRFACLALHIVPLSPAKRAEALVTEEYGILERIALGQHSDETLEELALLVERYGPDVMCAISLVEDGVQRVKVAPNLPDAVVSALDGSRVSPGVLNAGDAVSRLDTAVTEDVLDDPRWTGARSLVESTGVRACWSVAIISSKSTHPTENDAEPRRGLGAHRSGAALGVVEVFRTEAGAPEPDHWQVPVLAARLAAIVLERERFIAALQHQATHDALTGLRNRRGLAEWLEDAAWDASLGLGMMPSATVLFCDIDRFKVMNDRHGHEFGDHLLEAVAVRLRDLAPADAAVARLGGDEFLLASLTPGDEAEALMWAEDVRAALGASIVVDGIPCTPRVSIGVAQGQVLPHEVDELVRNADTAVYEAKAAGRDRCIVFDDELRDEYRLRVDTERDLVEAIENGDLLVHLQPVIDAESGQVVGVEALARWNHPRRGLLLPNAFVGVAEEAGLVTTLDRWVASSALAQLAEIGAEREEDLAVWVNLSAMDLAHDGLVPELLALARARPGLRLGVELTESALAVDPVGANDVLNELRDGGLGVAIDDFGTGFSSLTALRTYPFTHVKIDRSFVVGMVEDPRDAAIVTSIITMARAFGMVTVAEGVESVEQLAALRSAGIDHVQGFAMSRPGPLHELTAQFGPLLDGAVIAL